MIGSRDGFRGASGDPRSVPAGVGEAHRGPRADCSRPRRRRGPRAGRTRRRARAVARVRHPGQPGRLAHGQRRSTALSTRCAAVPCSSASTRSWVENSTRTLSAPWRDVEAAIDDDIGDDLLRLVFTACHPVLSTDARVALTLRLLGGLTTDEIARAFLVPEPTIAQRIVRAKRTLAEARRYPSRCPAATSCATRLESVLAVVYLIFNEGYSATAGDDVMRPALCEDALRLGRVLAELAPEESDVHGLVALMELNASRSAARDGAVGRTGAPPGSEPGPVGSGARSIAGSPRSHGRRRSAESRRPYALQAAIAACHGRARTPDETDWPRIAALYGELAELDAVFRHRAESRRRCLDGGGACRGPRDGRRVERRAARSKAITSCRAHAPSFSPGSDGWSEAAAEFERAASLTRNERERARLLDRAAACVGGAPEEAPTIPER